MNHLREIYKYNSKMHSVVSCHTLCFVSRMSDNIADSSPLVAGYSEMAKTVKAIQDVNLAIHGTELVLCSFARPQSGTSFDNLVQELEKCHNAIKGLWEGIMTTREELTRSFGPGSPVYGSEIGNSDETTIARLQNISLESGEELVVINDFVTDLEISMDYIDKMIRGYDFMVADYAYPLAQRLGYSQRSLQFIVGF